MSLLFKPSTTERMENQHFDVYSAQTVTFTIDIRCRTGYELTATVVADALVEGRVTGGGGWTNLETTPLPLDTWAGTDQEFDIRVTAGSTTSILHRAFTLDVAQP